MSQLPKLRLTYASRNTRSTFFVVYKFCSAEFVEAKRYFEMVFVRKRESAAFVL